MELSGFAIALAWPQTYCKRAGSWYDLFTKFWKFRHGDYYQVGHSAIILIDEHGTCKYYDFGRYHTPYQYGRVRSEATDHELEIRTKAIVKADQIQNFKEILQEIFENENCHGEGDLHASYLKINFAKAETKISKFLKKECHKYGPLIWNGTNCSRFVQSILLAGIYKNRNHFWKVLLAPSISATPLHLVRSLQNSKKIEAREIVKLKNRKASKLVLPPKEKPHPEAQWFAGEGAGSWILIETLEDNFLMKKYSSNLKLESESIMQLSDHEKLNLNENYQLKFPVNCKETHLLQNNVYIILKNI